MDDQVDVLAVRNGDVPAERSSEKAYVRFINYTERSIELMWINFTGSYVSYQVLTKGRFIDINTFTRHPWIALDYKSRDRLKIDDAFTYFPKTTKQYFQLKCPNRVIPDDFEARIRAVVNVPLYSLRYLSLLAVRDCLSLADQADELELPNELVDDIKRVITQRGYQIAFTLEKVRTTP